MKNPMIPDETRPIAQDILVRNFQNNAALVDAFANLEIKGLGPVAKAELAFVLFTLLDNNNGSYNASYTNRNAKHKNGRGQNERITRIAYQSVD